MLIGYLVYFNVELRETYANSPYNSKRQNASQEKVVRGDILSADGNVLATTSIDENGKEYREYPYGSMFAHVVGYSASGTSGLEQKMNSYLLTSHANAWEQVENGFFSKKDMGDTVVTTLDVELQQAAYDALGKYKGAVVVMEPDTGKILAMVSKPDFNPNTILEDWEDINTDSTSSRLLNRATQGLYPPGSIFKVVTALAYWEQYHSLDKFYFDCDGELTKGGFTIHCYKGTSHGEEDFYKAFAKSCNAAFAQMGVDMNLGLYKKTAETLLFNKELPLDFVYRQSSFSLTEGQGDALTMQTAIGQGNTLVSPMHMALITSAIANNGVMMKPYLVERVESYDGKQIQSFSEKSYKKVMTAQESELLTKLMKNVVEYGTGTALSGKDYTVAGKTGTAEHGNVSVTTPHSWFIGFSNVEDPDIVVCVIAEEAGSGGSVAVPIANTIFDAYYK